MRVDASEDPQSDNRAKAELDLCLTLIRKLEIQLETAINLQFLADLENLTSDQVNTFRAQLCEQLGQMAESMVLFQVSRADSSRSERKS